MARGIYVMAAEPLSSKSLVVFGMMELLKSRARKIGYFVPILTETIDRTFIPGMCEATWAFDHDEAHDLISSGRYDEFLKTTIEKYRELESRCDIVLASGTDFRGATTPLELDFNVDVARNLGCRLLPVIRGADRKVEEIAEAAATIADGLLKRGCDLLSIIANRVRPKDLAACRSALIESVPSGLPAFAIPENPLLAKPGIREIARAIGARFFDGEADCDSREVLSYKVSGMELPHLLDHLSDGTLVISAGDRTDILIGTLAVDSALNFPRLAGIVLTGGLEPAPRVQDLVAGFNKTSLPILTVETDTFETAVNVSKVQGLLDSSNQRKRETALGLFEANVDVTELKRRLDLERPNQVTPLMFEHDLIQRAKARRQRIVLPEGDDPRILRACDLLSRRQVCEMVLLGNESEIRAKIVELGLKGDDLAVIDPARSPLRETYARAYFEMRRHKGVTMEVALETMADPSYFGTMMVQLDQAGAMVSGAAHTTQATIRPALEFVKTKPGVSLVSSIFFMCLADRVLVFGDCAVNPNPDEKQLAEIAISSADSAIAFGIEPRVAMLSYSTGESGKGRDVEKVRAATQIAKAARPDLRIEGPLQFDAAIDPEVARLKMPSSEVAGRATVFIFPDLNTGNNTYKAVQRSANAVAIGPILQGLNKPVNDLSRGCTVADIVNTVAISAIQAQRAKERPRELKK